MISTRTQIFTLLVLLAWLNIYCSAALTNNILYVWTGDADNHDNDFLASISLDPTTFGDVISLTPVDTSANEPHHMGYNPVSKVMAAGGLLSLLQGQDSIFFFNLSNPFKPSYMKSTSMNRSACTDEVLALDNGGFLITMMGSASGGSPGAVAEFDGNLNKVGEYPTGATELTIPEFNPHGLVVNIEADIFVTSDYVLPSSTLKPTDGPVLRSTVRIWGFSNRTVLRTVTIPNCVGVMDVSFLPGDNIRHHFIASNGNGTKISLIDPYSGSVTPFFDFQLNGNGSLAMLMRISSSGFLYTTTTLGNRVMTLNINNASNPIRVDNPLEDQPVVGPHYIALTPDESHLIVVDYFLDECSAGVVNPPADLMVHVVPIIQSGVYKGSLDFSNSQTFDFATMFTSGRAHPHAVVILDVTDYLKQNPSSSSGLSDAAKVGLGLGLGLGIPCLALLLFILCCVPFVAKKDTPKETLGIYAASSDGIKPTSTEKVIKSVNETAIPVPTPINQFQSPAETNGGLANKPVNVEGGNSANENV